MSRQRFAAVVAVVVVAATAVLGIVVARRLSFSCGQQSHVVGRVRVPDIVQSG